MISLSSSRAQATIDPEGGRLSALSVDGHDLLVPPTERPTRWGSFPMIPWCGRLPYGLLRVGEASYHFPVTSPPHANHGRTHLQTWDRVEVGAEAAIIATRFVDPWPFAGGAVQRFLITDTTLTVTAEVLVNEPMPAMIGWHPWFRRQLTRGGPAELDFEASSYYETDEDDIPTGEISPLPSDACQQPLNRCITGMTKNPIINWPDAFTLGVVSTLSHWVVFTEPEHALCIEPQSGPPNQLNDNPQMVTEDEPLIGSMTFYWE